MSLVARSVLSGAKSNLPTNFAKGKTTLRWPKVLTFPSQDQATQCMESNILNSCVDLDDSHRFGSSDKAYMSPIWYFHHKQSTPCFEPMTIVSQHSLENFEKFACFWTFSNFQAEHSTLRRCRTLVQCPLISRAIFM